MWIFKSSTKGGGMRRGQQGGWILSKHNICICGNIATKPINLYN
jgi:hypothetical protein